MDKTFSPTVNMVVIPSINNGVKLRYETKSNHHLKQLASQGSSTMAKHLNRDRNNEAEDNGPPQSYQMREAPTR